MGRPGDCDRSAPQNAHLRIRRMRFSANRHCQRTRRSHTHRSSSALRTFPQALTRGRSQVRSQHRCNQRIKICKNRLLLNPNHQFFPHVIQCGAARSRPRAGLQYEGAVSSSCQGREPDGSRQTSEEVNISGEQLFFLKWSVEEAGTALVHEGIITSDALARTLSEM